MEFEWCTAVALKKTVIPYLIDTTPLPPSLAADQGIDTRKPAEAIPLILLALQRQPSQADPTHTTAVIDQLAAIKPTKEKEVATIAKAIFVQQQWVQGDINKAARDVNRAGRDINITNVSTAREKTAKTWLEKWGLVAGLAVSMLTVLTLIPQVSKEWPGILWPSDRQAVEHSLGGYIQDEESNQDLSEVTVIVTSAEFSRTAKTDKTGYFIFRDLPARKNLRVRLKAEKEGYADRIEENMELGDSQMKFAMKKVSP